jgi:GT2 family glycosyltransferase
MKSRNSSGFYKDYINGRLSSTVYEVDFVNAAAWMLSSECINKVGLFHPLFSHYGEDDNYVDRVKFLGLKTGVLASTSIRHDRDSRIKNPLRVNYKLRFQRTLLKMLLHPKNSSHAKIFFKAMIILITSRGRWPVLPDPGFCFWGGKEFFRQKNIVSKYRDEVENDKN